MDIDVLVELVAHAKQFGYQQCLLDASDMLLQAADLADARQRMHVMLADCIPPDHPKIVNGLLADLGVTT